MKIGAVPPNDPAVALKRLFIGLNRRLTLSENMQSVQMTVNDSGPADTEFTVTHGLGKTPYHYIYNVNKAGTVYDSRRDEWTPKVMYLKCSAANAQITLTIL